MTQTIAISPLAPACFPELPQIEGIRIAVAAAGIKYQNRDDVMLLCADEGSSAAGVFTRSATASAAVDFSRQALATGKACAVLTNSGNANAFTGQKGTASVLRYRQGWQTSWDVQLRAYHGCLNRGDWCWKQIK